jgi:proteasome lid subunit RPN8/RPN11
MTIDISRALLAAIKAHAAKAFPEETAGFLMGTRDPERRVRALLPVENDREQTARHNRYLIPALEFVRAEREAELQNYELLGIYHSHPNHPSMPSEFDREWAQPVFTYFITSVQDGEVRDTRAWVLHADRAGFEEETIQLRDEGDIG